MLLEPEAKPLALVAGLVGVPCPAEVEIAEMKKVGVEGVRFAVITHLLEASGTHTLEDLLARTVELARQAHETRDGVEPPAGARPPVAPSPREDLHEIGVPRGEVTRLVIAVAEIGAPFARLPIRGRRDTITQRPVVEHRKIEPRPVPAHQLGGLALERAEKAPHEVLFRGVHVPERPAVKRGGGPVDDGDDDDPLEREREKLAAVAFLPADLEHGLEDIRVTHRRIEIVHPPRRLAVGHGLDVKGQDLVVVHAIGWSRPPEKRREDADGHNLSMGVFRSSPSSPTGAPRADRRTTFRARLLAVAWLPAAVSVVALSLFILGARLERQAGNEAREGVALARAFVRTVHRAPFAGVRERYLAKALVRRQTIRTVVLHRPGGAVLRLVRPARPLPWFARAIAPLAHLLAPRTAPMVIRRRLVHSGGTVLVLHLALHPLLRRDARIVLRGLTLLLLALGLSLVLAFRLLRAIIRPLERLTGAFDRLRAGDLAARVAEDSPGEFGRLERHFNRMAERIAAHQHELESRIAQATADLRAHLGEMARKNEELEATRRAAEAANRAKTEFLANMSHEIRTPMNAVLGYSELLAASGLDHDQQSYVEAVRSSGESLLSLIDEILDLARIETGHLHLEHAPCDPRALAERVADMLAPQAYQKELEFITDFYVEPTRPVLGDGEKIRQILTNLIANAIKFTARGAIAVTLHQHDEGERIEYECLVEDTGPGIPGEARARIFEPFTQADGSIARSHGGAGLGLAIARRLVEAMGGRLTHQAREGGGSAFRLHLTLPACGPVTAADGRDPLLAGCHALVLCLDAERARRIASLLGAWGLTSTTLSGADLIEAQRAPPSLAGTDLAVLAIGAGEIATEPPWRGRWRPPPPLPVLVLASTADRRRIRRLARHFGGPCLPVHTAQEEIRRRLHTLVSPADASSLVVDADIRQLLAEELPRDRAALETTASNREELAELLHRLDGTARFCRFEALKGALEEGRTRLARGETPALALTPVREAIDAILAQLRPANPTPLRPTTGRLAGLTVLVADDNRLNRELMTRMLVRHGASVESCPDGRSALARADEVAWNAAFLDIHMPDVDGLVVLAELHRRFPERPAFALSADVFLETRRAAERAGAVDYLLKPITEERILAAVLTARARVVSNGSVPAA